MVIRRYNTFMNVGFKLTRTESPFQVSLLLVPVDEVAWYRTLVP
jgi:hypothetical protein